MSWPGVTMFLLFFGIATMDALTSRNWLRIAFWVAMGVGFALLDLVGQPAPHSTSVAGRL